MSEVEARAAELLGRDLNLLVALDVLGRSPSVTAAAKTMGLTQSAMSHQLRRLRELMDDPLFITTSRPMRATARAEALLPRLRETLETLRQLTAPSNDFDPRESKRRFVIACSDISEFTGALQTLEAAQQAAPNIEVAFVGRSPTSEADLARGAVDIVIMPEGVPGIQTPGAGFRRRKLVDEDFAVLVTDSHPVLGTGLTLEHYLAYPHLLISPSGSRRGVVDAVLAGMGKTRRVRMQLAHFATAPFVIAGTELILTCPASFATVACTRAHLRKLAPPLPLPTVTAAMFWHERVHHDPGHRWLRTFIAEHNAALSATRARQG
ncbi:MAG: LysR family transcriptional regulator [Myxococcota bacterium]